MDTILLTTNDQDTCSNKCFCVLPTLLLGMHWGRIGSIEKRKENCLYKIHFLDGDKSPEGVSAKEIFSQKEYYRLVSERHIARNDPPYSEGAEDASGVSVTDSPPSKEPRKTPYVVTPDQPKCKARKSAHLSSSLTKKAKMAELPNMPMVAGDFPLGIWESQLVWLLSYVKAHKYSTQEPPHMTVSELRFLLTKVWPKLVADEAAKNVSLESLVCDLAEELRNRDSSIARSSVRNYHTMVKQFLVGDKNRLLKVKAIKDLFQGIKALWGMSESDSEGEFGTDECESDLKDSPKASEALDSNSEEDKLFEDDYGLFDDDDGGNGDGEVQQADAGDGSFDSDPDGLFDGDDINEGADVDDSDPDGLFADDDDDGDDVDVSTDGMDTSQPYSTSSKARTTKERILYPSAPPTKSKSKSVKKKKPPVVETTSGPIQVMRPNPDHHFLRWLFGNRLMIREELLTDAMKTADGRLPKHILENGFTYSILVVKVEKNRAKYKRFEQHVARAFYVAVSGPGLTPLILQEELNKIADFASQSCRRIVPRLELLVSPACYYRKGTADEMALQFIRPEHEFEIIDEHFNEGSGFCSPQWLKTILGDRAEGCGLTSVGVAVVQIRIECPNLGIFKGLLMIKLGISKVQLPTSMRKVGPSKCTQKSFQGVFVTINAIFPSASAINLNRLLNPQMKDPPPSGEKDLEPLGADAKAILACVGVPEDLMWQYEERSRGWSGRKHGSLVGVADPTNMLPEGTIFVTGMGVGIGAGETEIFTTRFPCTEIGDSLVLPRVTKRPAKMNIKDWKMLCGIHFGIVIFAKPKDPNAVSIPARLAGGDLDGDLYLLLWDQDILSCIDREFLEVNGRVGAEGALGTTTNDDPLINTQYFKKDKNSKTKSAYITRKNEDGQYTVTYEDLSEEVLPREEIMKGREFVSKIVDHRGKGGSLEVQVQWESGELTWRLLDKELKNEIQDVLGDYAREHKLETRKDWAWLQRNTRYAEILDIIDHRKRDGCGEVHVRFDDGSKSWEAIQEVKPDQKNLDVEDILVMYAQEHEELLGWEEFAWVDSYLKKAREGWFDRTQDLLVDAKRFNDFSALRRKLYMLYTERKKKGYELDDPDVLMLGRAYKESNDLLKHGGRVTLPIHFEPLFHTNKGLKDHINWKI
jgi:hypothetical protein